MGGSLFFFFVSHVSFGDASHGGNLENVTGRISIHSDGSLGAKKGLVWVVGEVVRI
jgi:hypothetical protein